MKVTEVSDLGRVYRSKEFFFGMRSLRIGVEDSIMNANPIKKIVCVHIGRNFPKARCRDVLLSKVAFFELKT